MDFMFWGAFTWDTKCKPHIWEKETPAEKKAAAKEIKKWNQENEERLKEEWELETAMRRLNIMLHYADFLVAIEAHISLIASQTPTPPPS